MPTVKFDTGQTVNFDSMPSPQDIEEVANKLGIKPPAPTAPQGGTLTGPDNPIGKLPVIKQAVQLGTGIGSAVGKAALNIPKAILNASQGIAGLIGDKVDYSPATKAIDSLSNNLFQKPVETELNTFGGRTGEAIGTVAPYALGLGGAISKGANLAREGAQATKAVPLLGKVLANPVGRTLAGATAEGLGNYGAGYALSGGDTKQAKNQGLLAGGIGGALSGLGETANALKAPESLMGNIFKTDKKEMSAIFSGAKNDTFAKEVLDRGFKGSTKDLAKQFGQGLTDSEQKIADSFVKAGNPKITLEEPQRFVDYLQTKANSLKQAGAIKEAQGLQATIPAIDQKTGQITANNALALRRFLDGLRYEKSYLSPTEELSSQQAGLKEMSDEIRHKINAIGGTGDAMKDYQFYIKGLEKVTNHAVKTHNNDALGIINSLLLGESIANTNPLLAGGATARQYLRTTRGATTGAQLLKNLPKASPTGTTVRSAIASQLSQQ